MKLSRKHLLLASLMAVMTASASAQTAMPASGESSAAATAGSERSQRAERGDRGDRAKRGEHARHGGKNPAERHAQRMSALKEQLKLSPAQEGAWQQFAAAMQPPAAPAQGQRPDREALEKMTTPQRLDAMQRLSDERQARMRQRTEAVKAFYAQLTPEQQKTFDARGMKGHGGKPGKHEKMCDGKGKGKGEGKGRDRGHPGAQGERGPRGQGPQG